MNQRGEKPKRPAFSTDDHLDLIREYGIEFEGRILPETWGLNTAMFEEIRRIGGLRLQEFRAMFQEGDEYLDDKTVQASELMQEAWYCLENMSSEYAWRKDVEFKAFKCFDSELIW
jgi:hypothetical protein